MEDTYKSFVTEIVEKETGATCGSHGGEMKFIGGFVRKFEVMNAHKEDLIVDGRTALKWVLNS